MNKIFAIFSIVLIVALTKLSTIHTTQDLVACAPRPYIPSLLISAFNYGIKGGVFVSSSLVSQWNKRLAYPSADAKQAYDTLKSLNIYRFF